MLLSSNHMGRVLSDILGLNVKLKHVSDPSGVLVLRVPVPSNLFCVSLTSNRVEVRLAR